jgi:hypothetical protein
MVDVGCHLFVSLRQILNRMENIPCAQLVPFDVYENMPLAYSNDDDKIAEETQQRFLPLISDELNIAIETTVSLSNYRYGR